MRAWRVILIVAVVALAAPSAASAWRYKFQDFFDTSGGAAASSVIKAKKCHGGKLGNYKLVSRVASVAQTTELHYEVKATLPVTEKFKPLKDIEVTVEASDNFDPDVLTELSNATAEFWKTVSARWKPGKLKFKHGSLVVFGAEVLPPGKNTVKFKPKPGC
ncbi:MAG: hypothetical protein ACRDL3_01970 [Solirubrobacterales bacterium]